MQASRSLFQSAFKDPTQKTARGVSKSRPFLNVWAPSPSVQQYQFHTAAKLRNMASATSFYDFKPIDKRGQPVPLADHKGKVVLVVNVASKCGFTPQYEGLEKIYKDIKAKHGDDFTILGFPCNQFGGQEPGSDEEVQSFCQLNYGVTFPIMGKSDVNGDNANPLYEWLKKEQPGLLGMKRIKWNFEKFLIGRDGKVAGRWASTTKPEALEKPILEELAKPAPA
ncbi:Thioredoxin-like protein [Glarea lozoyensis ATCC 20868]|uniref:Glutathione peroxidase n=2 Tax=Glarea lozoyensis TaxID=101852 RepID=S3CX21_GLAL2|nr:Thioredoxin-like protein [Glarea lozoyensis ATCC 20868]EPE30180.1 Thioredoxin-like protein [Glarea lozoyensis ATCC 20868]